MQRKEFLKLQYKLLVFIVTVTLQICFQDDNLFPWLVNGIFPSQHEQQV